VSVTKQVDDRHARQNGVNVNQFSNLLIPPAFGITLAIAVPDRWTVYGGVISGLVTLVGALAAGTVALRTDNPKSIGRAAAVGGGAGGLVGLALALADALS
jgi:hypothetical protein